MADHEWWEEAWERGWERGSWGAGHTRKRKLIKRMRMMAMAMKEPGPIAINSSACMIARMRIAFCRCCTTMPMVMQSRSAPKILRASMMRKLKILAPLVSIPRRAMLATAISM